MPEFQLRKIKKKKNEKIKIKKLKKINDCIYLGMASHFTNTLMLK